jgi:ribonuclease-3
MVNRRTLASEARRLGLGEHLILSRGEQASGGRERLSALADAFEAVLGALFIDGGYEVTRGFILQCFQNLFDQQAGIPNLENPKGELQELLQSQSSEPPRYELTSATGPDHDRIFECAVFHQQNELGRGSGKSKKEAESQAALVALTRVRDTASPEAEQDTGTEPSEAKPA